MENVNGVDDIPFWTENLAIIYRLIVDWLGHLLVRCPRVSTAIPAHDDAFSNSDGGASIYEIVSGSATLALASASTLAVPISCSVNIQLMFSSPAARLNNIISSQSIRGTLFRSTSLGHEPDPCYPSHCHHRVPYHLTYWSNIVWQEGHIRIMDIHISFVI